MEKNKGYLLPAGDAFTDEMACTLVYYPNKPEYRRALGGSLAYLATWIAWEKESEHKGIDAALSWQIAYDLTVGCWQMACLEQLQADVADILAIMKLGNSCCDDQDITDGDRYTDRVTDGVGDVPQNIIDAGYATDAADWGGFDDYKCMIVHVTVNQMEARLREIDDVVDRAGPYLGVAAALSAIISVVVATGGLAIVFGIIAGIGAVSALYFGLIEFGPVGDLADEVADNHEELACAMYAADGDEGAIVALNDKIDELFSVTEALILKNLNNGPTLKALYSGRYDLQDIAAELEAAGYDLGDFSCDCIELIGEYQVTYIWPVGQGFQGWQKDAQTTVPDVYGNPPACLQCRYDSGLIWVTSNILRTRVGLGTFQQADTVTMLRVEFDYMMTSAIVGTLRVEMDKEPGPWFEANYANVLDWTHVVLNIPQGGYVILGGSIALQFTSPGGTGNYFRVDNVYVDFDAPDP